jgi:hypothetical protein
MTKATFFSFPLTETSNLEIPFCIAAPQKALSRKKILLGTLYVNSVWNRVVQSVRSFSGFTNWQSELVSGSEGLEGISRFFQWEVAQILSLSINGFRHISGISFMDISVNRSQIVFIFQLILFFIHSVSCTENYIWMDWVPQYLLTLVALCSNRGH